MHVGLSESNLYAFWKYDQFPYLLGGKVTRINDIGKVETEEFGKNYWFSPIKFLPEDSAKKLLLKLKELEEKRRQDMEKLYKKFNVELKIELSNYDIKLER